ncbi:MAG TPA: hypothetical protein VLA16_16655 [Ideonella sp.]|nr:hypothetical protein [Ideonella sp.]
MKEALAVAFFGLTLGGCATGLATPEAIRQDQSVITTVCSPLPQAVAVSRLKQAWETCKVGSSTSKIWVPVGGVATPISVNNASMQVVVEDSSAQAAVVLRSSSTRVLALADFKPSTGATCKTVVTVRGWNTFWEKFAQHTSVWLNDPGAAGPQGSCL